MKYENLIFDLYGTLCEIRTEEDLPSVWEKLCLYYGYNGAAYTPAELHSAFDSEAAGRNMKAGQNYEGFPDMPIEPVFAALFENKGVTGDLPQLADTAAQLFRIESTIFIRLYPNVLQALGKLRNAGFSLFLLSNAQAAYTARELRMLGLENAFDKICLSSDYGIRKPDPGFIGGLIRGSGLDPAKCLMIGNDMDTDIAGAQRVGVAGLFVKTGMELGSGRPDYILEGNDWNVLADEIIKTAQ